MLIKLAQSDFLNALNITQRGVSSQSTLPILTGVKIKADAKNNITLQSTDLELSIETHCAADVKNQGTVVVTGKLLLEIIKHLPDGAIELSSEEEEKNLVVKTAKAAFKVKTMPPEDFPAFPEAEDKKSIMVESDTLLEMIKQTSKAISRDETRPALTGALLNSKANNLLMVATDSYRLAVKTAPLKNKSKEELSLLIPVKAVEEMQKALSSTSGEVKLSTDDNLLKIETKTAVIITRLIEGQFPNYEQLIPKETSLKAEVDKNDMAGAISRVALLAQKNMSVKMRVEKNKIQIKAATQGVGEAHEEIKAKTSGENFEEMAFNAQYLLEGVQSAEGEVVRMEFTGPVNPGIIKSGKKEDYLYLVMPIRIS